MVAKTDIMFLDGEELRGLPLVERKERLSAILPTDKLLIYSGHWPEHGKRVFREAQKLGLEGIMAKRAQSKYLSGARTRDWLKIKTGKRRGAVRRVHGPAPVTAIFRDLALAGRHGNAWRYIGRVGIGFSNATLKAIHGKLSSLRISGSPFRQKVKDEATTTWVKPKLVAEVRFTEWTDAGEMRHLRFWGFGATRTRRTWSWERRVLSPNVEATSPSGNGRSSHARQGYHVGRNHRPRRPRVRVRAPDPHIQTDPRVLGRARSPVLPVLGSASCFDLAVHGLSSGAKVRGREINAVYDAPTLFRCCTSTANPRCQAPLHGLRPPPHRAIGELDPSSCAELAPEFRRRAPVASWGSFLCGCCAAN
jgi:hypothetical protein